MLLTQVIRSLNEYIQLIAYMYNYVYDKNQLLFLVAGINVVDSIIYENIPVKACLSQLYVPVIVEKTLQVM